VTSTIGGPPPAPPPGADGPSGPGGPGGSEGQGRAAEAPRPARSRRLSALDENSLRLWLLTRVSVFVLASAGGWLFIDNRNAVRPVPYLDRWMQWDTVHYVSIATWGYDGNPAARPQFPPLEAFFPGLPLVLRAMHAVFGLDYVLAGLVVSFLAGAVAVVALGRLAALEAPAGVDPEALASRTVLLFLLAPSAIFLAACYTEALFLGFAIPAWLAARRGRWVLACTLAAGASAVRVTGLFLACALVVHFLTSEDGRRWRQLPALALPFAPLGAYVVYLHGRTGDWMAWQHAQERGWNRRTTMPWDSLETTWRAATDGTQNTIWAWSFGAEIVAAAVGVALTGWLLWRRRWGESTYVGLQVVAFTTSSFFFSVPRATLLWWPLWIALAVWTLKRPTLHHAYLAGIAPFMVVFTLMFTMGADHWAG
jgi:hypothetical protein